MLPRSLCDVIATGTPNGAGARFDPPKYLKDGDVVAVEVPGIGTLSNIESEFAHDRLEQLYARLADSYTTLNSGDR